YVVNLSLGSNYGPHDGTSDYEQFVSGFIDQASTGRAVVVAAGNEREDSSHAHGTFDVNVNNGTVILEMNVGKKGQGKDDMYVDIWLAGQLIGATLTVVSPGSVFVGTYGNGQYDEYFHSTNAGWVGVTNAGDGPSALTGDREILILIRDSGAFENPVPGDLRVAEGKWQIYLTAASGSFDAYLGATEGLEARFVTDISEDGTIGVPATAPQVISVGAYTARTDWLTLADNYDWAGEVIPPATPGALASFSSIGPNRRGDIKPEITAPGQWVMASLSSAAWPDQQGSLSIFWTSREDRRNLFFTPDSIHAVARGTSFAAPVVAGICALLLEADPALSNQGLKDLLTATARVDS
ncbi:MAG TPA: S8 family serine peptidase, partial [Candidatus Glassbacteria bacterium]|nr:S8 family serine peptidase [Candidatus Glassbacteria bacterium]